MRVFNNAKLFFDLSKVISIVGDSISKHDLPDIARNKIDEKEGNQSFVIDIEDLAFFYYGEKERDEDFETLISLLPRFSKDLIITLMKSDIQSYSDTIEMIESSPNYFTAENVNYWTHWFYGSNMSNFNI